MSNTFIPFFSERQILTKEIHARTLRYSSNVRFWKMMLPFIAFSAFTGLFIWPYIENYFDHIQPDISQSQRIMPEIKLTNKLLNPRLRTLDAHGRPVTLHAESAIQTSDQSAHMVHPESQMQMQDGQHISVRSQQGTYNQVDQSFQYQDHVILNSGTGIKIQTAEATMNLKTHEAEGHSAVTGETPDGKMQGEGFKILDAGKKFHLLGKSKLTIANHPPHPMDKGEPNLAN